MPPTLSGMMTPERAIVFGRAMARQKDPEKLYALAESFDREGLLEQGAELRGRADWFMVRECTFARAITWQQDPEVLRRLARWFAELGLHEHAMHLEKRAASREALRNTKP